MSHPWMSLEDWIHNEKHSAADTLRIALWGPEQKVWFCPDTWHVERVTWEMGDI